MTLTTPLRNSYTVLKDNPVVAVPLLLFSILGVILGIGFTFLLISGLTVGSNSAIAIVGGGIVILVLVFIGALMQGIYISIAQQGLKGKPDLGTAFARAKERWIPMVGLAILIGVIEVVILGAFIWLANLGQYASLLTTTPSMADLLTIVAALLPFVLLTLAIFVVLSILFYIAPVLIMVENLGVMDAFTKSINLGSKNFVNILLFLIIVFILDVIISILFSIVGIIPILGQLLNFVLSILLGVWSTMLPAMFYFEYFAGTKPPVAKKK